MPVTPDHCRRWGCHRPISNGAQCGTCISGHHIKCTGLTAAQYDEIRKPDVEFKCMICITESYLHLHGTSHQSNTPTVQTDPICLTAPRQGAATPSPLKADRPWTQTPLTHQSPLGSPNHRICRYPRRLLISLKPRKNQTVTR